MSAYTLNLFKERLDSHGAESLTKTILFTVTNAAGALKYLPRLKHITSFIRSTHMHKIMDIFRA